MALPRGQDFIPLRVPDSFPLWLQVKGRSHPALLLELRPARILIHTSDFHTSLSLLPTLPPSHPALPTAYQLPRPFSSCSPSHSPAARSGVQPLHLEEQIPLPSQLLSELTVSLKTNKKAHTQNTNKYNTHSLPSPSTRRDERVMVSSSNLACWMVLYSSSFQRVDINWPQGSTEMPSPHP